MDLRELRTFVAVVEEGRFSRAAQRLHLSQSAISQTIRGLERDCGIILFDRTNAGAVATSAGELLFAEARAVLARHEQAVAAMFRRREENSALRIGVPLELPHGLLSGALSTLAVDYPSTAIAVRHVCTARQIDGLSSGDIDLGLLRHRPANLDLDASLVADEPLGVLVSETQADRLGALDELGLEALVGLDWHGFPKQNSPVWFDELTATLRSHGLHIGAMTSQTGEVSAEVTYASVSLGRSFALAPASCQNALPPAIRWRRLTGDPIRRRTWAAWSATSCRRDLGHLVALLEKDLDGEPAGDEASPCHDPIDNQGRGFRLANGSYS